MGKTKKNKTKIDENTKHNCIKYIQVHMYRKNEIMKQTAMLRFVGVGERRLWTGKTKMKL